MPNPPTVSEQWFDQYLNDHGYAFQVEPDLGVPTRPDRLIERHGVAAICEVKEFTTDALIRRWPEGGSQVGTFDAEEWFLSVRRSISGAARQLEPLAEDSRPLVIVLANPNRVAVDLTARKLMEAMQGQLTIQISLATEAGRPMEPRFVLGEDGRLAGDQAPWISAVVGLRHGSHQSDWERAWIEQWKAERWPDDQLAPDDLVPRAVAYTEALKQTLEQEDVPTGEYFYAEVVEAISDRAVPLPRNIFDGDRDSRWIVNREANTWDLLA